MTNDRGRPGKAAPEQRTRRVAHRPDDLTRVLRADALYALLTGDDPAGRAENVADIYGLRDLTGWPRKAVLSAIIDLIADRRMRVGAEGRLELGEATA